MAAKHHHYVALTEPLPRFVEDQVAEGSHVSVSEVVCSDLRLLIERQDASTPLSSYESQPHG